MGLQDKLKTYERQQIEDALEQGGTAPRAAELLDIPLRTLQRRMARYGLSSASPDQPTDGEAPQ